MIAECSTLSFIYGLIAASISGVGTAFVLHWLTTKRDKRLRYTAAADEFRDAFHSEITALAPGHGERPNPYKILPEVFAKHKQAIFKFARVLDSEKRTALTNAWQGYYSYESKIGMFEFFHQYDTEGMDREESNKRKNLAYNRLLKVVSFAD